MTQNTSPATPSVTEHDFTVRQNRPGKVLALHLNYPSRIAQRGRSPQFPGYFIKAGTSIARSGDAVERPAGTELLAYEGEIALIIGRTARRVRPEEGWSYVSGITAANDWGLYDLRHADKGSNVKNKSGDGYTPLGPAVIAAANLDPAALRVRTWVNGALVQDDTTEGLVFPFGQLVADLSQLMTLEEGDVILTGTPAGSSVAQPGDVVEVEVDAPTAPGAPSTGRLITHVTDSDIPMADYGHGPRVDDLQREEAWGSREAAGLAPVEDAPAQDDAAPASTAVDENGHWVASAPQPDRSLLTPELRAKIDAIAVATLTAQLQKRGIQNATIDGPRPIHQGRRVLGYAKTLRYIPKREDLFKEFGGGFNAQKRAIDSVQPDDVVVMEARGEHGTGTLGDVLALRAQVNGANAVITDGGIRDSAAVAEVGLQVYAGATHPAVLGRRHIPWEVGGTIACGGTTVQPGDIIVGDDDGVVVVPPSLLQEVVDDAYEQELQDAWAYEQVKAGHPVDGMFPPNAEWKAKFDEYRKTLPDAPAPEGDA
ncbi:fumarylacetoacetate hydrolase family protein [Micrococcus porci]|uniref:fumarylacetoacetate hydrolase family protein n=1 Tax=Micrococcus porci TaxID=2856555 RepID=UPI001CCF85E2|nr:fumarylacetoacetate hydrolase family protein [Micrococcus porci]UBH25371.1 fumarylacetoacetate hydrolase family protein [Micrococcus porci]